MTFGAVRTVQAADLLLPIYTLHSFNNDNYNANIYGIGISTSRDITEVSFTYVPKNSNKNPSTYTQVMFNVKQTPTVKFTAGIGVATGYVINPRVYYLFAMQYSIFELSTTYPGGKLTDTVDILNLQLRIPL